MTTDKLENALAFAGSDEHSGDLRTILGQAKGACRTLAKEIGRLHAVVDKQRTVIVGLVDAIKGTSVWGRHDGNCCARCDGSEYECDCGHVNLHAAVEAAEEAKG